MLQPDGNSILDNGTRRCASCSAGSVRLDPGAGSGRLPSIDQLRQGIMRKARYSHLLARLVLFQILFLTVDVPQLLTKKPF
jgi:hypothetical protein